MKVMGLISTLLLTSSGLVFAANDFHFDEGQPGCFDEIRGRSLTSAEIKSLSPPCLLVRQDYLKAIVLASDHPQDLIEKINRSLKKADSANSPYIATLFAALSTSPEVLPGLQARAEIERKLKLPFRYAEAALYRMQGHDCGEKTDYLHPYYREVCTGQDRILSTSLVALNRSNAKDKK